MRSRRFVGALIGLSSALVAVSVGHLVAVFTDEAASPIAAVGSAAIDLAPSGVKEWAISTFGTQDKLVLIAGICVVLALIAAGLGIVAMRQRAVAYVAIGGFGLVGAIAAMTRPAAGSVAPLPSIAAAVAGLLCLRPLFTAATPRPATETHDSPLDFDRRRFLFTGAGLGVVAAGAGIGSLFAGAGTKRSAASRQALKIPPPSDRAASAAGSDLRVAGLSPFRTPNRTFYRVDTALIVPKIDAEDWRLRIHGMVDREIDLDMADLLARPLVERDITLACVSNEVGGDYIGNARWIGALLKPVLEEAGVHADADQLVSKSADGWTAGTPTSVMMDGRDAMLAVAMNGEPLPLNHGFPVRIVVPGLYGYVSATKWVVDIELTTFDAFDAYWIPRGWSRLAPVKTMSRIDTPRSDVAPGEVPIAGVAWAQQTGIAKVEVRIDDGPWREAELAPEDTIDTWRQWVYRWDARPGAHTIAVRATDKAGYTQTADRAPPIPDGATGWHTIETNVREV